MGEQSRPSVGSIVEEKDLTSAAYDGILLVAPPGPDFQPPAKLSSAVAAALTYDPTLDTEIAILPLPDLPAARLVYAPTGPLDPDYDDVRSLQETAIKGVKRALKAGMRKLLVVLENYTRFENAQVVTLLGVLEALYVKLPALSFCTEKCTWDPKWITYTVLQLLLTSPLPAYENCPTLDKGKTTFTADVPTR